MKSLRQQALQILLECNADAKAARTAALDLQGPLDTHAVLSEPPGIPGRPARPELFAKLQFKKKALTTVEGRAVLLHTLAHIELNAIDLALDIVWRFAGMPDAFYRQWLNIAQEEAYHFALLRDHIRTLGYDYGDFPAHNGLWEMAEKTKHDLLARLALVPRTLEARGLDASPPVKAKLVSAGDLRAGDILDIILRDEIGHVAVGNHWYNSLCTHQQLDPIATYTTLAACYGAPRPRGPFNWEARRAAGFTADELTALSATSDDPIPLAASHSDT
ncbi:MAG: ferritin-like domain-containing protein [Burkholderiales bacterium]|nr:ferritin-like domain-containing protein [Burkholderiales bacterium]